LACELNEFGVVKVTW